MDDNKRTQLAIFLCFLAIVIYSELFLRPTFESQVGVVKDKGAQLEQNQRGGASDKITNSSINDSTNRVGATPSTQDLSMSSNTNINVNTDKLNSGKIENFTTKRTPTLKEIEQSGFFTVNTPLYQALITKKGGALYSFKLKKHKVSLNDDSPLDIIKKTDGAYLPLTISWDNGSDSSFVYKIKGEDIDNINLKDKQKSITLVAEAGEVFIEKTFKFEEDTYKVELSYNTNLPKETALVVSAYLSEDLLANSRIDPWSFMVLKENDKIENIFLANLKEGSSRQEFKRPKWLAIGDKYFAIAVVPLSQNVLNGSVEYVKNGVFYGKIFINKNASAKFIMHLGPKEYGYLEKEGYELSRLVNLGFFAFLAHPLLQLLRVYYLLLGNWGLAIILLTLTVKLLLFPLAQSSFKSMKAMQELQPEIQALRERIKDPSELNREIMAIYKRRGVNPMGGCFPMFIQIPIFLGLYNALLNAIELRHSAYALWINDLSAPERLYVGGVGVPVMIIIMGISMLVQQWLTPSAMDPAQKKAMMLMPLVFTIMFIIFPFPSGLVLYWLINNLISIVQQWLIRSEKHPRPFFATLFASFAIFAFGYILTLI